MSLPTNHMMHYKMQFAITIIALLATLAWDITATFEEQSQQTISADELLYKKFQKSFANSTDYVRAIRESLEDYEYNRLKSKHTRSKRAVKRVCYGELGCFEDSGPFAYLEMLPSAPEEINTKFFFYSTKNRSDRPLMELPFLNMTAAFDKFKDSKSTKRSVSSEENVATTTDSTTTTTTTTTTTSKMSRLKQPPFTIDNLKGFDELSIRIIVHGFGSACPHVWIYEMKTALMAVEDCIVICVDWENGATFPNYVRAAANTRLVGKQLAMLINNLKEHKGLNLTKTHIIGFSLGAHVSGFAGAELPGLSRITGLDPAGPLFEAQHPKVRLDSTDAEFVDVIHSNGENLILGGLGSWQPMGHVDFYPNGGRVQTGCSNLFVGAVTDFIWSAQAADEEEGRSLCNHRRAYKFFIDSVAQRCMFPAFPCDNYDNFLSGKCFPCAQDTEDLEEGVPRCGNMGYYANRSTGRGQLYLVTRDEEPFCAHQFQLQIFNSFNDLPLRTIGRLEATLEGEGGLNETFKISEKDDSEFFAGDIVSKIIVPHPALGYPTTLSLNYKSYSGWLSKGLPHWDIDKIVLTDSFGRSHSLCKPSTKLSSGSPIRMKLQPGDCELENQDDYGTFTTASTTDVPDSSGQESVVIPAAATLMNDDGIENTKQRKDIFNLGASFKLGPNSTYQLEETNDLPWQPIIEGNSLDKENEVEASRSLSSSEPIEIFEPVLKDRRLAVNRGRGLPDAGVTEEIVEPVLKATTPRHKKAKELLLTEAPPTVVIASERKSVKQTEQITTNSPITNRPKVATQTRQEEVVTVQLFPFRLGDLLQRAERYARETLLPLISLQAPKFFGFNFTPSEEQPKEQQLKEEPRKPRYIPRFEEAAFLNSTQKNKRSDGDTTTSKKAKPAHDLVASESQEQRNIFKLMREGGKTRGNSRSDELKSDGALDVSYYTNVLYSESRALQPEDPSYKPIFIELPTYRPPKARTVRSPLLAGSKVKRLRIVSKQRP